MRISGKVTAIASAVALCAASLAGTPAEASAHRKIPAAKAMRHSMHKTVRRQHAAMASKDWPFGWNNNSCFNLPYLPAQYACSAKGGE